MLNMHIICRSDFREVDDGSEVDFFGDLCIAAGAASSYEEAEEIETLTIWIEQSATEVD